MAECDRLVWHRDDYAVEVRQLLRGLEEILDVGGLDLQRDHDPVMAARVEALRDAGRRFHLRDRVADGDVDAGRAVEGREHFLLRFFHCEVEIGQFAPLCSPPLRGGLGRGARVARTICATPTPNPSPAKGRSRPSSTGYGGGSAPSVWRGLQYSDLYFVKLSLRSFIISSGLYPAFLALSAHSA